MARPWWIRLKRFARRVLPGERAAPPKPQLPLTGFTEHRTKAPLVELLDDETLAELNDLLPWQSFTVDGKGRRFGNWTRPGRRDQPQPVPDPRTAVMDELFDLHDKHVMEFGCFEGIHTVGLCQLAREVTAVDGHLENVVKTIVRTAFYGHRPNTFLFDVERLEDLGFEVDVVHSLGVFYHLREPVRHLMQLGKLARVGVFIDTVVADPAKATESMVVDGSTYHYERYEEPQGRKAVRAGLYDHSKFMLVDDIVRVLGAAGFEQVIPFEPVWEREHLKATIVARRAPSPAWSAMGPRRTLEVPYNA
jgi:hypothetical protein